MTSIVYPEVRQNDLVIQKLKAELLIYDLRTNRAFCLNEICALIWHLSDGTKTVSEIGGELSGKLKNIVPEDLIWLALNDLKKANLLANGETISPQFDGLSRRQLIRRIGFASMIAIPVISSLVAPPAAAAASCLVAGSPVGTPITTVNCGPLGADARDSVCNAMFGAQCCSKNAQVLSCDVFSDLYTCRCTV